MILPEHQVLKLLLDKGKYLRYNKYIDIYNKDNIYLYNIYKSLEALHSKTENSVSLEDLHVEFLSQHANLNATDRALYDEVFRLIHEASASEDQVDSLISAVVQKARLQELALKAYEAANTGKGFDDVQVLAEALTKPEVPKEEFEFVTDDLEELYKAQVQLPGLRWRLQSLNHAAGSLRKGDLSVIFARPETGKTTFLASEVSFMAEQTDRPVFWFNNEQEGRVVQIRVMQATLGVPLEQLFSNRKRCQQEYHRLTKGNLRIIDDATISRKLVEAMCRQYNPALIIFDQLDKVKGFQSDRDDLVLGAIYQWARELAKQYGPVIGVCQADGTAEGVKWLNMGHMANAKTAKQAEADLILGIGFANTPELEMVRHFSICKNKLFGDQDSIPAMRHGRWDVLIEPTIARYKDII